MRILHGWLLDRASAREAIEPAEFRVDLPLKYKAFDMPSVFVVGYGLGCNLHSWAASVRGLPSRQRPIG